VYVKRHDGERNRILEWIGQIDAASATFRPCAFGAHGFHISRAPAPIVTVSAYESPVEAALPGFLSGRKNMSQGVPWGLGAT